MARPTGEWAAVCAHVVRFPHSVRLSVYMYPLSLSLSPSLLSARACPLLAVAFESLAAKKKQHKKESTDAADLFLRFSSDRSKGNSGVQTKYKDGRCGWQFVLSVL